MINIYFDFDFVVDKNYFEFKLGRGTIQTDFKGKVKVVINLNCEKIEQGQGLETGNTLLLI